MSSRLIKIPVFGLFLDRTNRQFSIVKTLMPVTQNFDEDVRKIDVDALRGANAEFSTVHSSVAGELIATTLKPCPEPEFGELIVTLLKNAGACPLAFHEIYPKFSLHVISCDLCRGKVSALAKLDMPPAPVTPIFTEPQESLSVTQPLQ